MELVLGNIESQRDWGRAQDYVQAMWLMLQYHTAEDYVVATGESHSVRDFVEAAFAVVDLPWQKYVKHDPAFIDRQNRPGRSVARIRFARCLAGSLEGLFASLSVIWLRRSSPRSIRVIKQGRTEMAEASRKRCRCVFARRVVNREKKYY